MGNKLKFYSSDIDFDNIDEIDLNHHFSPNAIRNSLNKKPVFSYRSIDLDKTEYKFNQDCFTNEDIKKYFQILNEFSNMSLNQILDSTQKYHFHESPLKGNLLDVFKRYTNNSNIRDYEIPSIYHFALYNSEDRDKASRKTGIKSPRIYFMIGSFCTFHILFYDPYHEINPTNY